MTISLPHARRADSEAARPEPVAVFKDQAAATPASIRAVSPQKRGTGYAKYQYSIAGLVGVISDIRLPELDFFKVGRLPIAVDIEVRRGRVGQRSPRMRAQLTRWFGPDAVRYEEHLGGLGANFAVDFADRVRVTASPLLAGSPHVLYTNVIEALLRFIFVSKGAILLHSACVEMDGTGVMLSAKTDTGKTGTILRLLREKGAKFLSDDMTILLDDGTAFAYPKPLTISAHTLRAVNPGDVGALEWGVLNVKGRLHSKSGRAVGLGLGELNMPIMSANSVVQLMVPPPKYPVDRLVDCQIIDSTTVSQMFIIERGLPSLSVVPADQAITELVSNTDDAYGFPPFRYFAPHMVIRGRGYEELRQRETEIMTSALEGVTVHRMGSDSFSWADEIPEVLRGSRDQVEGAGSGLRDSK